MTGRRNLNDDLVVDFSGIIGAIWRAKVGLLFAALAVAALVFVFSITVSPRYKADSEVFVESREVQVTRNRSSGGEVESTRAALDAEGVASVAQLIASRDNALKVIRELNLIDNAELNPALSGGLVQDLLAMVGLSDPLEEFAEERTLQKFMSQLTVSPIRASRIIKVEFKSKNRTLAAEVPNALVQTFLNNQATASRPENKAVLGVLDAEIKSLRERVEAADIRVADFRASSNLEQTGGINNTSIASQQLNDISTQLGQVRTARASAQAKADEIRRIIQAGGAVDTVADVQASPLIQRLVERQAAIRAQIAQLSSSLLPGHPRVQSLQSQLSDLEREVISQARKVVASLDNQVKILNTNEEELNGEFNRLRVTAREVDTAAATLSKIEGEAASLRELLTTYQGRYNQAVARRDQEANPVNARIAARATVPATAYFPKIIPMTLVGFIGTLMLGVLWIMARELLTGSAMRAVSAPTTDQKEAELQNVIATMQRNHLDDEEDAQLIADLTHHNAPSIDAVDADAALLQQFSERNASEDRIAAEVVAAQMAANMEIYNASEVAALLAVDGNRRVIVVSPQGDVGALGCVDLARGLSVAGHQTVLVDMAGTWTGTTALMGMADHIGVTDILAGAASFSHIIQKDPKSNLHIIPSGSHDHAGATGGLGRMKMVLDALQESYAFVIVDCGQASAASAAHMACENAVGVISVENASASILSETMDEMQTAGFQSVPIIDGIVEDAPMPATSLLDRIAG